jgi:hypothetical protein
MLIYLSTTPKETTTVESEITIPLLQTLPPAMIPKQTVTQIPSMIANLKICTLARRLQMISKMIIHAKVKFTFSCL